MNNENIINVNCKIIFDIFVVVVSFRIYKIELQNRRNQIVYIKYENELFHENKLFATITLNDCFEIIQKKIYYEFDHIDDDVLIQKLKLRTINFNFFIFVYLFNDIENNL